MVEVLWGATFEAVVMFGDVCLSVLGEARQHYSCFSPASVCGLVINSGCVAL